MLLILSDLVLFCNCKKIFIRVDYKLLKIVEVSEISFWKTFIKFYWALELFLDLRLLSILLIAFWHEVQVSSFSFWLPRKNQKTISWMSLIRAGSSGRRGGPVDPFARRPFKLKRGSISSAWVKAFWTNRTAKCWLDLESCRIATTRSWSGSYMWTFLRTLKNVDLFSADELLCSRELWRDEELLWEDELLCAWKLWWEEEPLWADACELLWKDELLWALEEWCEDELFGARELLRTLSCRIGDEWIGDSCKADPFVAWRDDVPVALSTDSTDAFDRIVFFFCVTASSSSEYSSSSSKSSSELVSSSSFEPLGQIFKIEK